MRVINKPNSLALRKARWLGICLFSSLLSAAPWLYAQSDGKTAEDNHGPFLLSTDLDLEIELIVSHMIRAYSVTGKNKIELSVDSDHTASGSQNYCVDSNGREAKTYLTVNSEDASGNQFRLIKESGSTTLNMDVFITDHLNGETKKQVAPGEKSLITAGTQSNPCHATNGSTQLLVKTGKIAEEGTYRTILRLTFATY